MSDGSSRDRERRAASPVTLRDVAREAGVSIKTVSRVVNGEREVNAQTAARVAKVVEKMGYRPNELARSLRSRRSNTIGLMIADISNPFYSGCAKAVEEVARQHGCTVILCASSEEEKTERTYVELLAQRRVDGLLLVPVGDGHEYLAAQQTAGMSVVALDRPVEGLETDSVVVQNRVGTRKAIEHLIEHGHRRIAFVGDQEHVYTTLKRLQGYREALEQAGLEEIYRLGAGGIVPAEAATRELLGAPEPPTAFFAANNLISVGMLRALEHAGLRIPEDAAFAAFDDFELAAVLHPRLTLIRQPAYELGRAAAELLFDRLEGRGPSSRQHLVLPTELIVRESCGRH